MKREAALQLLFFVYFIFFGSSGSVTGNVKESGKTGISVGDFAPDLTFKTIDGQILSIRDLKGKTVILQGFASWCPSCKFQAGEIGKVLDSLGDKGDNIQIISLDIWQGETADDVRKNFIPDVFGSENEIPRNWEFTAYEPDFVTTYRVYAMDETYILDENGIIIFKDPQVTRTKTFLKVLGDKNGS
ncbi:MAG: TlpA family protein disulfide reductase [Bacteroidetes bacterium]|nr:TlpA family protein disulfide reductase [Bacteroidota bacterium]